MVRTEFKGALFGFSIGVIILSLVFGLVLFCFPYRLSVLSNPLLCRDPFFNLFGYLSFPVNILTNDLSRVVFFSPLPLLIYTTLGVLLYKKNA